MSSDKKDTNPSKNDNAAETAPEPELSESVKSTPSEDGPTNVQELINALDGLREENAALKDKLMRTLADMENLRSRTEREKSDMAKYAIANFARDILTIGDNLTRALESSPKEAAETDPAVKSMLEGVEITNRELQKTLERHGVKQIQAKDHPFDPNLHDAMFEVPNPDINAGLVVEVVHDGYTIGDRVLRPAAVGVSKGGAKIIKEPENEEHANPEEDTKPGEADEKSQKPADQDQETPQNKPDPAVGEKIDKSA